MRLFKILFFCSFFLIDCAFSQDCLPPTQFNVINATDSSVVIEWQEPTDVSDIIAFRINIRQFDQEYPTDWYEANISPSYNNYSFNQLNPQTEYEIKMKTVCAASVSSASFFSFYTSSGCTDSLACNYDPDAIYENNSCNYDIYTQASDCFAYVWNGSIYNQSGTYYFPSISSCPKEILDLTILNYETFYDTVVACESYNWGNIVYNESGDYTNTFMSLDGCDSLVNLNLTFANFDTSITIETCDSYTWNDSTYTQSGIYTQLFTNEFGCDSLVSLNLIINEQHSSFETVFESANSYFWNGLNLTQSGTFTFDTISSLGCDSSLTIELFLSNPVVPQDEYTICLGDTIQITAFQSDIGNIPGFTYGGNFNGNQYYISNYSTTWTEGDSIAQVYGSNLVTINSHEENNFVNGLSNSNIWLGIYSIQDSLESVTGEEINYVNWNILQNDSLGNVGLMYGSDDPINNSFNSESSWAMVSNNYFPSNNTPTYTVLEFPNVLNWVDNYGNLLGSNYNISVSPSLTTTYFISYQNALDSIIVNVLDTSMFSENITSCDNFLWNDSLYIESGNYQFITQNTNGCDSIVNLNLIVNKSFYDTIFATACNEFEWQEQIFNESGLYEFNTVSSTGCDSNIVLNLTISNDALFDTINVSTCQNSYTWNDSVYTESGFYSYVIEPSDSVFCDSIIILNLTLEESYYSEYTLFECSDTLEIDGIIYTESGIYSQNYSSVFGCDSIVVLNLWLSSIDLQQNDVTICQGDTITLTSYQSNIGEIPGFTYYGVFDGNHYYLSNFPTTWSEADSIAQFYQSNLVAINSEAENIFVSDITDDNIWLGLINQQNNFTWSSGESFDFVNWNDFQPFGNGNYTIMYGSNDNINNTLDSEGSWALANDVEFPSNNLPAFAIIEFSNNLIWSANNENLSSNTSIKVSPNETTIYYTSLNNFSDSVVVNVLDTSSLFEIISSCNDFLWNDSLYYESGNYQFLTQNVNGCDSTTYLDLTILNSSFDTSIISACNIYEWNSQIYTTSGLYNYEYVNSQGCNSISTLDLTINDNNFESINVTACDGYNWNGVTYVESGLYSFDTINEFGCDSTIYLDLTILNSSYDTSIISACNIYDWNGSSYSESGVYNFVTTNLSGCDSTATLILTISNSSSSNTDVTVCDSYIWNGVTYTESGVYTFNTNNESDCDSVATLNLIITNSSSSIEDVLVCNSYEWNGEIYNETGIYTFDTTNVFGCDSLATLNLSVVDTINYNYSVNSCGEYMFNDTALTESGTYTFSGVNDLGCDTITTLELEICLSETLELTGDNNVTINSNSVYSVQDNNGSEFEWILTNGLGIISFGQGDNEINIDWLENDGVEKLCVVEKYNCSDIKCIGDTFCVNINVINPQSITANDMSVNIFPNPSSNVFNVEFISTSDTEILVNNLLAETVYYKSTNSTGKFNTQIDLSHYPKGVYSLTIKTYNGISNYRLILQ